MSAKRKVEVEEYLPFFVYGTLMSGHGNHHRFGPTVSDGGTMTERAAYIEDILPGRVYGFQMLDLGSFPMAVQSNEDSYAIKGQLIYVHADDYTKVLASLDQLEGYRKGSPNNHYERIIVPVKHRVTTKEANGVFKDVERTALAWMYAGNQQYSTLGHTNVVPFGDWAPHVKSKRN